MDAGDTGELRGAVPEELEKEVVCNWTRNARLMERQEQRNLQEEHEEEPGNIHGAGSAEAFADPNKLPKCLKTWTQLRKVFIPGEDVHGELSGHQQVCGGENEHRAGPQDMLLERVAPPHQELQAGPSGDAQEQPCCHGNQQLQACYPPKVLQWDSVWRWQSVILMVLALVALMGVLASYLLKEF